MSKPLRAFCLRHSISAVQLGLENQVLQEIQSSFGWWFGSVTAFLLLFQYYFFLPYSDTDTAGS